VAGFLGELHLCQFTPTFLGRADSSLGIVLRQRLERVLRRAGEVHFLENFESVPTQSSVLLIRGDYLYDDRVINKLFETTNVMLQAGPDGARVVVAANVPSSQAVQAWELINGLSNETALPGIRTEIRRPSLRHIRRASKSQIRLLFYPLPKQTVVSWNSDFLQGSYKGVTDLVTKWIWPRPAQWCTRVCTRFGLSPNQVTFTGFILVIIATILFAAVSSVGVYWQGG